MTTVPAKEALLAIEQARAAVQQTFLYACVRLQEEF